MAIKINPYQQLIWRNPNTLQIGLDSRSQSITNITPAEERFIDALYYGVTASQIPSLAKQIRMEPERAQALLARLTPLLVETTNHAESSIHLADQIQAALDNNEDPTSVVARRGKSVVQIHQLDSSGLTLMLALAAAGVGTVSSADNSKVTNADCASNVYPRSLLGHSRYQSAKLILDSSWPGCRMVNLLRTTKNAPASDVHVLVSHQTTDPQEILKARSINTGLIELRYSSSGSEISPVITALSGCLNCRELHMQDADPNYAAVTTQLMDGQLRFDDSATRLATCGIAAQSILAHLDGNVADPSLGFAYTRLPEPQLSDVTWAKHDECSCPRLATGVRRLAAAS